MNQQGTDDRVPYRGPAVYGVPSDKVLPGILDPDASPELWVPQTESFFFKPIVFNVTDGYFVNLVKVTKSGMLSRHRHTGPVHAMTMRGRWHYLEHDWVATAGGYTFEPPGDIHTLIVPDDVDEMVTLFHVTGAYVYVDPDGVPEGYEDVFTKLAMAREHFENIGLGADYADRFVI
jgi:quercetin dioxygenase-like cupin family protein